MSRRNKLEAEFHDEMVNTYIEAKKECRYNARRFFQMVNQYGGVETARRLMATEDVAQSGLTRLYLCDRLDISVEAKMLLPKYAVLFADELRAIARKRLEEREFDFGSLEISPGSAE